MAAMRVVVFGKPGGGKSTLSERIARLTGAPLHALDRVQYLDGGERVPDEVFARRHAEILAQAHWVIDGYGIPQTFEIALQRAEVLVYIDRPQWLHYWWVTKRLLKSPFSPPPGWPERSPMWRSTLSGWRHLRLSHRFWTPAFRQRLLALQPPQRVVIIRTSADVQALLAELQLMSAAARVN